MLKEKIIIECYLNKISDNIFKLSTIGAGAKLLSKRALHRFTKDDLIRLYKLEYQIARLSSDPASMSGLGQSVINKLRFELKELLHKALYVLKEAYDLWLKYHAKKLSRLNDLEGFEDYLDAVISLNRDSNPSESLDSIVEKSKKELEEAKLVYNNIMKLYPSISKGATGNYEKDIETFSIGLSAAHNSGVMIDYLAGVIDDAEGITPELLRDLSSGAYFNEWDKEMLQRNASFKLSKRATEWTKEEAEELIKQNNFGYFFNYRLNEKYPDLGKLAAEELIKQNDFISFFDYHLNEKYPDLEKLAAEGLIKQNCCGLFFNYRLDEKYPDLEKLAAEGLIKQNDFRAFINYHLIEKYPDLEKLVAEGLIKQNNFRYFFNYRLNEKYPDLEKLVAEGLIKQNNFRYFFNYRLNEKYPELISLIGFDNDLKARGLQLNQDKKLNNFVSITKSNYQDAQRLSEWSNNTRYDFAINNPIIKHDDLENKVLSSIFHQTLQGTHQVGLPGFTKSFALISFPDPKTVLIEELQSDLPPILHRLENKSTELKSKYGEAEYNNFIQAATEHAILYPYIIIQKVAEFAEQNALTTIKIPTADVIKNVANISNDTKLNRIYNDIPNKLGFTQQDQYWIYSGDMSSLQSNSLKLQRIVKDNINPNKPNMSKRDERKVKLIDLDTLLPKLQNILGDRINKLNITNNLPELMRSLSILNKNGVINNKELSACANLINQHIIASMLNLLIKYGEVEYKMLSKRAEDPLSAYNKKRDPDETPEPEGKAEKGQNKHRFVIQKHNADKAGLHFDFRLENDDGTMSSWAIPKAHLPNKKERLLAAKTEDHPVNYMKFEGEISSGYGAGKVEIYDSGTYEEIEWKSDKIVFKLNGKKEKGEYALIHTDAKRWLIVKKQE